jgi:hypothetical protein
MAGKKKIADAVRAEVEDRVTQFNRNVIEDSYRYFSARFRGKYVYLDRENYGYVSQRARLTYTGDMEQWKFAIYKHSDERYDPREWMFPGAEHLDGTVESAPARRDEGLSLSPASQ